jgi:hypothetical protein
MLLEGRSWTRRRFFRVLPLMLGATGAVGCGPEGVGSVKLENRGAKLNAFLKKGAGKSHGPIPGPHDMRPADGRPRSAPN